MAREVTSDGNKMTALASAGTCTGVVAEGDFGALGLRLDLGDRADRHTRRSGTSSPTNMPLLLAK